MTGKLMTFSLSMAILLSQQAGAGEFYKLYPRWLELGYHIVMTVIILGGLLVCWSIFSNFKGGKLGFPWIFIILSLMAVLIRMVMSLLTVFDIQYFRAIAFAGLDVLFFILLLIGLILYKVSLE